MKGGIFISFFLLFILSSGILQGQNDSPQQKQGYSAKMENFRVKKKDFKRLRYLTAGGSISLLTYYGDLAPAENFLSTDASQIKPGISGFLNYHYGPRISLRAELLYGRLTGDDYTSADPNDLQARNRYIRNLSFRNDILDFSICPQIYIFKNYLDFRERKFFNIYFNAGISVFYHNPKGRVPDFKPSGERYPNVGEWVALRPLGTEGQMSEYYDLKPYSNFQFSIPFGGGFAFRLNEKLDLFFEVNYRILLTDYIDDVSGKFVDLGALSGDMAKSMSDRSQEQYSIMSGQERDKELILGNTEFVTYVSKYDGNRYTVFQGYGQEGGARGGAANDTFLMTGFKISYILNKLK